MRDSATPSVKDLMNDLFDPKPTNKAGLGESAVNEALGLLKNAAKNANFKDPLDVLFGKGDDSVKNPFKVNKDQDKDLFKCASIINDDKKHSAEINKCAAIFDGSKNLHKTDDHGIFACAYKIKPENIVDRGGDRGIYSCAYLIKHGDKDTDGTFKCAYKVQLGKNDKTDVFGCVYKIDKKEFTAMDLNKLKNFEK